MNKYSVIFLLLIFIGCKSQNQKLFKNVKWISFEWKDYHTGQDTIKYGAMELITNIEGIKQKVSMQFDTGAPNTVIYENALNTLFKDSLSYPFKIDWSTKIKMSNLDAYKIKNLKVLSNGFVFKIGNPYLLKNYGSIKEKKIPHIGSIGSDIFKNKCLILNFKDRKIGIVDSLTQNDLKNIKLIDFKKTKIEQTVIEIEIGNQKHNFIYDTGTSPWSFLTGENKFNEISNNKTVILDSIQISTWGKKNYVYEGKLNSSITIGGEKFDNNEGYFYKENQITKYLNDNGISGILGNKIFIENNKTIIIDYKNKKFGILK